LGFTDKLLQAIYNQVDTLKQEILEVNTTQDGLRVELLAAMMKLKVLRLSWRL
jgi:hypothetical protein